MTAIGSGAFYGDTTLTTVTFGDSLTTISSEAFYGCISLKKVEIPDSVTTIGSSAFYGCTSMEEAVIGKSVTTIEGEAFRKCSSLSKVMIGKSVTTINNRAFYQCSRLRGAYFKGNAPVSFGSEVFSETRDKFCIYYDVDTLRWTSNWNGYRAIGTNDLQAVYNQQKQMEIEEAKALMVKGIKAEWTYSNSVKVYWTGLASAESYTLYRATSKNGTYTAIATITDNYYYDQKVKTNGAVYYYKVVANMNIGGTVYKGMDSAIKTMVTPINRVTLSSVINKKGKKVLLKWKKVSGVTGYEIYRAEGYFGKYKKIKTVTKATTTSFTNTKLKKGKSYYYKIRAYKTVDGKKVYGDYSYSLSTYVAK